MTTAPYRLPARMCACRYHYHNITTIIRLNLPTNLPTYLPTYPPTHHDHRSHVRCRYRQAVRVSMGHVFAMPVVRCRYP
jgi:hypothetical protein